MFGGTNHIVQPCPLDQLQASNSPALQKFYYPYSLAGKTTDRRTFDEGFAEPELFESYLSNDIFVAFHFISIEQGSLV